MLDVLGAIKFALGLFCRNSEVRYLRPLVVVYCFVMSFGTFAQNDSSGFFMKGNVSDIKGIKPETLLNEENVSVASQFKSGIYEAPGVITVITEEDIKNGGYRDIMDVLNQIPGFSLASDVQNGISFGVRGNWAEEAKLLFMLDGMPLNELSYGTYLIAQRIPLLNIRRIEVIRGSGSSKYGGTAALGVINVITKTGQELSGHRILTTAGAAGKAISRSSITYNYGGLLPNNVEITTMGTINQGNLSNCKLKLPDSTVVNLADSSRLTSAQIYLTLKYKGLKFKQFYEDYNFQSTYEPIYSLNRTSITEIEKNLELGKLDINATINHKDQIPWNTLYGDPLVYDAQNLLTRRTMAGFSSKSKFSKPFQFLGGLNWYVDNVRHHRSTLLLSNGKRTQQLIGTSGYAEALFNSKYAIFNLGARFEKYAYFKPNFAPRLSITKRFKFWNYKLIYNQAYKIPALQNINLDTEKSIIPEEIEEIQAQLGFDLSKLRLTVTYFNTKIKNLIVYGYNLTTLTESYINSAALNNDGIEIEASYQYQKFRLSGNYSFNRLLSSSSPEIMRDTGNAKAGFLALPAHKAVAMLKFIINTNVSLNCNYVYESKKEAVVRVNSFSDEYASLMFPATHNLALVYNHDRLFSENTELSVGVYNLLQTNLYYLYPFSSGYQPLTGMNRELLLTLKIKF